MTHKMLDFSTILASSIHDMKNSLGMVLSSLEGVVDEHGNCNCTADKVSQLQYEAKRVNDNLIQLLTLYTIGTSGYTPNIAEVEVRDFIEESYLLNKPLFDFRHIEAEVRCDENLTWYFDPYLMGGVIDNVVTNAIRYTSDRLLISAERENGFLCIRVDDNGRGFPEHMVGRGHWDAEKPDLLSGRTKLGLYFCSLIASLHTNGGREGYIELRNGGTLGGGCFAIYLP